MLSTDGESCILYQGLTTPVQQEMKRLGIDYVKLPPSLTHKHQAADCGPVFESVKAGNDLFTRTKSYTDSVPLRKHLQDAFRACAAEFRGCRLTAAFRRRCARRSYGWCM